MKRKIIFLLVLMFIMKLNASALTYGGCEYSTISRLKSLVTNVNISYSYHMEGNEPYFDVTLTNITPDMYFKDTLTNTIYNYDNTNNGEITITNYKGYSGSYKFYSTNGACYGISLGTKYYKFPSYNNYYTDEQCADIKNYSLCQKWVNVNYNYDEFSKLIAEYKESLNAKDDDELDVEYNNGLLNTIISFYTKYYYLILIGIILICSVIIFINRRRNKFDL